MTSSKMISFVQQTIFFLAGVSLVVSGPLGDSQTTEDQISSNPNEDSDSTSTQEVNLGDPNAINVIDAVTSVAELTEDQRQKLQGPMAKLAESFDGTLFGSLFSFILKRLQNPDELAAPEFDNAELFKKPSLAMQAFLSTLQKLNDKVIQESQVQFQEIFKILGDSRFATFFKEILTTLNMRQELLQFANMGDAMLKNLPQMLADANKMGGDAVQRLIQNPEAMAAIMPNLGGMQGFIPGRVQMPASATKLMTNPAEALSAVQSLTNRVRLNPVRKGYVPRIIPLSQINPSQQQIPGLPTFKPILGGSQNSMSV